MGPKLKRRQKTKSSGDSKEGKGESLLESLEVDKPSEQEESKQLATEVSDEVGAVPDGIHPIALSLSTQGSLNCVVGKHLTEKRPWILLKTKTILNNIKKKGERFEFNDFLDHIKDYGDAELLLIYDVDRKYGSDFYFCTDTRKKQQLLRDFFNVKIKQILQFIHLANRQTSQQRIKRESVHDPSDPTQIDHAIVPRTWESLGSEAEIAEELVTPSRPKLAVVLQKADEGGGQSAVLSDREAAEAYVEFASHENHRFSLKRILADRGIDSVAEEVECSTQTRTAICHNAWTQYEALEEEDAQGILHSDRLCDFLRRVAPIVEENLQDNEISDIFSNDWNQLVSGARRASSGEEEEEITQLDIAESEFFTDFWFNRKKRVSSICWHHQYPDVIWVTFVERMTFEEKLDNYSEIFLRPKSIVLWNISHPFRPTLVLESSDDVTVVSVSPSDPSMVMGGAESGLLMGWNLGPFKRLLQSHPIQLNIRDESNVPYLHRSEREELDVPSVQMSCHSSVLHGHKKSISDTKWLVGFQTSNDGKLQPCSTDNDHPKFLSCATDGQVMVWDTKDVSECFRDEKTSSFGDWRPLAIVRVVSGPQERELGLGTIRLLLNRDREILYPRIKVFCGTEEGEILQGEWHLKTTSSEPVNLALKLLGRGHFGTVSTIAFSTLVPNIFASLGEWDIAFWDSKQQQRGGPMFKANYSWSSPSSLFWSPQRPCVLFVGRTDGMLEVWNLLVNTHQPTALHRVSEHPLTALGSCDHGHLLFVGDEDSSVSQLALPQTLYTASEEELEELVSSLQQESAKEDFLRDDLLPTDQEHTVSDDTVTYKEQLLNRFLQMEKKILQTLFPT